GGLLEGQLEQFALGAVGGAAEVERGAGEAGGGGGRLRGAAAGGPGSAAAALGSAALAVAALVAGPAGQLGDAADDELLVKDADEPGELDGDLALHTARLDLGD